MRKLGLREAWLSRVIFTPCLEYFLWVMQESSFWMMEVLIIRYSS